MKIFEKNLFLKKRHQATECETWGRCEFKYKIVDRVNLRSKTVYIEVGQLVKLIQIFYM